MQGSKGQYKRIQEKREKLGRKKKVLLKKLGTKGEYLRYKDELRRRSK